MTLDFDISNWTNCQVPLITNLPGEYNIDMARRQKISQMNPKGANLQATDLLEVSVLTGTGYDTYSITGQEIINAGGGGGSQDLQQVTDLGATTTNSITITSGVNDIIP